MLADGYQIIEEIGRGGMATVYLAIQKSLNRQVALKVLTHTAVPGFSERFLREARVIASLNHRHVVTIYDIGIEQERHYISMEYLTGGDLKSRISRGIPPATALRIVENIAGALQAAHEKGIVHRDVKPANILFREDDTPLLTDFGVAKQADTATHVTQTGAIVGTPAYLSPEHAHGIQLDGRADMYSLGIVLYEMLVGERPYEGDSDISTIFKHAYDPLPDLPEEHAYLQPFLNKLLAKRREDRFEDMEAMRSALRRLTHPAPAIQQGDGQEPAAGEMSPEPDEPAWLREIRDFFFTLKGGAVLGSLAATLIMILLLSPESGDKPVESDVSSANDPESGTGEQRPVDNQLVTTGRETGSHGNDDPAKADDSSAGSEPSDRPEPVAMSRVDALIETGNRRLVEDKIASPKGDNALYYFRLAKARDPGNADARRGLHQVASHYAVLAEQQLQERNHTQAEQFIDRGLRISPDHPRLLALNRRLKLQRASRKVERTSREALDSIKTFAEDVVDKIKDKTDRR